MEQKVQEWKAEEAELKLLEFEAPKEGDDALNAG